MCTNKTLKNHINRYHELSEQIKALEDLKRQESEYILAELDSRDVDRFDTVAITKRHTETADKKKLAETWPEIWEAVKKTSDSRFLRRCKAQ